MDKSAPWTLLKGTLAISAISGTATGFIGILRGQEHFGFLAGAAAMNSGMTATAFFSLREFIVGPILVYAVPTEQYERRRRELGIGRPTAERDDIPLSVASPSFADIRSHKVLDTTLSGAVASGLLRSWKSGGRVLPGTITGSVVCALLQLGYNEITVQRLKYVSKHRSLGSSAPLSTSSHVDMSESDAEALSSAGQPGTWKARILSLMGVRKMSEEEYLERLRLQRNQYLLRIEKLEQKLEEEKKASEKG